MTWLAPLLMTAAASSGMQVAEAHVTVEILRPAIVRQAGGWERGVDDAPTPQIARRDGMILVEFE
jgi:hypothetical protein